MDTLRYDVAIVGGGAAGLTGALVLGRARRRVVVIDAGAPRNAPAAHMHGFLSRDGMPPAELLAVGRAELRDYGVDFLADEVVAADIGFRLTVCGLRDIGRLDPPKSERRAGRLFRGEGMAETAAFARSDREA